MRRSPSTRASEFRIHTEKQQFDTTTVAYDQTYFGLPVWEASVAVHVKQRPVSGRRRELDAPSGSDGQAAAGAKALERFKEIDEPTLASLLGLKPGLEGRPSR